LGAISLAIDHLPRVAAANLPTPLEEAPRLTKAMGGPRIFIKRDDETGLGLGGNKARKLEFLFGEALAQGADTVLTTGGPQSNHARMTAALARRLGLFPVLVLAGKDPGNRQGNLLLDEILGAKIVFSGTDDDVATDAVMRRTAEELARAGRRPYVIPMGGSTPLGAVGYAAMAAELAAQTETMGLRIDRIFVAAGSQGTIGGILAGSRAIGASWRIEGVSVSRPAPAQRALAAGIAGATARLLGLTGEAAVFDPDQIVIHDQYVGAGYAKATPGGIAAIQMAARTEGIFLDPVYTGKAMDGLFDQIRQGTIGSGETVVFVHTGGAPALGLFEAEFRGESGQD